MNKWLIAYSRGQPQTSTLSSGRGPASPYFCPKAPRFPGRQASVPVLRPWQKFSSARCECDLTHAKFCPILCVSLGVVVPSSSASGGVLDACSWKDLFSRNIARRIGSEERPEWDACPAKPSKPLRIEAKSVVLPLGVRAEFLAGLRNRSTPFSLVCSRAFLCARSESCRNARAFAG